MAMMAIDSPADVYGFKVRSGCSDEPTPEKQSTPFSIDDILAGSKPGDDPGKMRTCSLSPIAQSAITKWPPCGSATSYWGRDAQVMWLESFQKLCAVSAFQPLWFSPFYSDLKYLNGCGNFLQPNGVYLPPRPRNAANVDAGVNVKTTRNKGGNEKPSSSRALPAEERVQNPSTLTSSPGPLIDDANSSQAHGSAWSTDSEDGRERPSSDQSDIGSPLSALERLTCATFQGMEKKQHQLHAVACGREKNRSKRRKCRTAFTSFQLSLLEQRFNCHKYLTPTDRDQIAHMLGLSTSQVITWFQNRRAKQKRDLEELRNDIKTVENTLKTGNVKSPVMGAARARNASPPTDTN